MFKWLLKFFKSGYNFFLIILH